MTEQSPSFWLSAAQWAYMILLSLFVWLRRPGEEAGKAVGSLAGDLAALQGRVSNIETTLHHTATREDLARLEGSVKQVDERTEGLTEGLTAVRHQLNRIETYLLTTK